MGGQVILHLIATNFFGGPERQIFEHSTRVSGGRYDIAVASFSDSECNELIEKVRDAGLSGFLLNTSSPCNPRQIAALKNLLKDNSVTLLCTHGYKSNVVGEVAARLCRIPHVAFCRGRTWENKKTALYNWLDWKFMGHADRVVAVSDGIKEQLIQFGIKPQKIVTVHNAIDADKFVNSQIGIRTFRDDISVGPDKFLFAAVGRFSPEKGQIYLVDAFREVVARFPHAHLALCGDGVDELKLRMRVKALNIGESVTFTGFRRDVANVFRSIDAMVLPSLSEGLPNVVLESFASKVPVVATSVGGVPELVFHDETGLLARPADPSDLAKQMCRMISDEALRTRLVDSARKLVLSDFSFDEQSKKLEMLYDEVFKLMKVKR